MRPSAVRQFIAMIFGGLDKLAVCANLLVVATLKADASRVWAALRAPLQFFQDNAWWLILAIMVFEVVVRAIAKTIGDEWAWHTIQKLVDDFQSDAFVNPNPPHEHRVTLFRRTLFAPFTWALNFRHLPGRRPWSGWVYPTLRSGHTSKNAAACFLAPDDARNAQGIAGHAWAQNTIISINNLPDLTSNSSPRELQTYCEATKVSIDSMSRRVRSGKKTARSYVAIPIESRRKRWGVLVLDSTDPNGIKSPSKLRLEQFAITIGAILERA